MLILFVKGMCNVDNIYKSWWISLTSNSVSPTWSTDPTNSRLYVSLGFAYWDKSLATHDFF